MGLHINVVNVKRYILYKFQEVDGSEKRNHSSGGLPITNKIKTKMKIVTRGSCIKSLD